MALASLVVAVVAVLGNVVLGTIAIRQAQTNGTLNERIVDLHSQIAALEAQRREDEVLDRDSARLVPSAIAGPATINHYPILVLTNIGRHAATQVEPTAEQTGRMTPPVIIQTIAPGQRYEHRQMPIPFMPPFNVIVRWTDGRAEPQEARMTVPSVEGG